MCYCLYLTISIPLICRPLLILFRYRTYTYPLQLSCHIFSVWHTVPVPNRLSPYIMSNANCPVSAVFIWLSLAASTYTLLVVSLSTGPICPYCFSATTIPGPGLLYSWLGNAELLKPPYHLQCSHDSSLLAAQFVLLCYIYSLFTWSMIIDLSCFHFLNLETGIMLSRLSEFYSLLLHCIQLLPLFIR